MGEMADWDIENGLLTEWEDGPHSVTCKYCGERYLYWVQVAPGKYRLSKEDGSLHVCKNYVRRGGGT